MNAEVALRRALIAAFADARVTANVENIRSRPWASATFSGTRHELRVRLSGSSGLPESPVIAGLGERDFDLPGHILIDIAAMEIDDDGDDHVLALDALTIEAD